jgi:vacuolar-type H+-ATPase subunit E/Vma4
VALQDILDRIAADAKAEADAIVAAAQADADARLATARDEAARTTARTVGSARSDAEREAATMAANARLRARDAALTARQALATDVLREVEAKLVALPDDRYAALIAAEVTGAAMGGETVRLGTADAARLRGPLEKALKAAGVDATIAAESAGVDRGAVLEGDRTRVEASAASLIAARHDELLAEADRLLFAGEGA